MKHKARTKLCEANLKQVDVERGRIPFVLTSRRVDRDSEVIEPIGAVIDEFIKNPVFLWAHDLRQPPIGKVDPDTITIMPKQVTAEVEFDMNDPFAKMVFNKYKDGFLNAGSIRFIPLEMEPPQENGQRGATITKWELLEFSAVPVPANPDALAKAVEEIGGVEDERAKTWAERLKEFADNDNFDHTPAGWVDFLEKTAEVEDPVEGLDRVSDELIMNDHTVKNENGDVSGISTQGKAGRVLSKRNMELIRNAISALQEILRIAEEAEQQQNDVEGEDTREKLGEEISKLATSVDELLGNVKRVIQFQATTPAPEGRMWDANAAIGRIRRWASTDGSGSPDSMNWAQYRRAFAWYDVENAETFGAYKLPHHDVINNQLVVVWRGVAAAMAALLGARGGVNIPDADCRGVYDHLAGHYRQFEKEPPEFKMYEEDDNKEFDALERLIKDEDLQSLLVDEIVKLMVNEGERENE